MYCTHLYVYEREYCMSKPRALIDHESKSQKDYSITLYDPFSSFCLKKLSSSKAKIDLLSYHMIIYTITGTPHVLNNQ